MNTQSNSSANWRIAASVEVSNSFKKYVAVAAVTHSRAWIVDSMKIVGFPYEKTRAQTISAHTSTTMWAAPTVWLWYACQISAVYRYIRCDSCALLSYLFVWNFNCAKGTVFVRSSVSVIGQHVRIFCNQFIEPTVDFIQIVVLLPSKSRAGQILWLFFID